MARTLSFDRDTVVRAARSLFWQTGYEVASIPDIEAATGLNRSSIYNAFGSKRGLFDAAVQSYLDEVIRPRLRPLQHEQVEEDALLGYLDGLRDAFSRASGLPGCLLVNTASTPLAENSEISQIITDYRAELRVAFGRGVSAYLPDATVAEVERLADTVTDLVIAAFALVRVAPDVAIHTLATARATITSEQ